MRKNSTDLYRSPYPLEKWGMKNPSIVHVYKIKNIKHFQVLSEKMGVIYNINRES